MSALHIYTIYYSPLDFPEKWVVRRHTMTGGKVLVDPPGKEVVTDSIDEARAAIPRGLYRMDRHPADVKSVVESWI